MSLLYIYLNFLEPSGPLQACNGTPLPFILLLTLYVRFFLSVKYVPILFFCYVITLLRHWVVEFYILDMRRP